jgi:hypothetical protein
LIFLFDHDLNTKDPKRIIFRGGRRGGNIVVIVVGGRRGRRRVKLKQLMLIGPMFWCIILIEAGEKFAGLR